MDHKKGENRQKLTKIKFFSITADLFKDQKDERSKTERSKDGIPNPDCPWVYLMVEYQCF